MIIISFEQFIREMYDSPDLRDATRLDAGAMAHYAKLGIVDKDRQQEIKRQQQQVEEDRATKANLHPNSLDAHLDNFAEWMEQNRQKGFSEEASEVAIANHFIKSRQPNARPFRVTDHDAEAIIMACCEELRPGVSAPGPYSFGQREDLENYVPVIPEGEEEDDGMVTFPTCRLSEDMDEATQTYLFSCLGDDVYAVIFYKTRHVFVESDAVLKDYNVVNTAKFGQELAAKWATFKELMPDYYAEWVADPYVQG